MQTANDSVKQTVENERHEILAIFGYVTATLASRGASQYRNAVASGGRGASRS